MQTPEPLAWLTKLLGSLQWPVIVCAAFWLGRSMTKLEGRVLRAEASLQAVIERHLPHIHAALSDIKETLAHISGQLGRGK